MCVILLVLLFKFKKKKKMCVHQLVKSWDIHGWCVVYLLQGFMLVCCSAVGCCVAGHTRVQGSVLLLLGRSHPPLLSRVAAAAVAAAAASAEPPPLPNKSLKEKKGKTKKTKQKQMSTTDDSSAVLFLFYHCLFPAVCIAEFLFFPLNLGSFINTQSLYIFFFFFN